MTTKICFGSPAFPVVDIKEAGTERMAEMFLASSRTPGIAVWQDVLFAPQQYGKISSVCLLENCKSQALRSVLDTCFQARCQLARTDF